MRYYPSCLTSLPAAAHAPVRLVDASGAVNTQQGRVEVLWDGVWGTVCDE